MGLLSVSHVELRDLNIRHPGEFHERFRTDDRRLLVVSLGSTGFSSVIICSARDEYFASMGFGVFPVCSAHLITLAASLEIDRDFEDKLAAALKDAGIHPQNFPAGLCSPLDRKSRIGTRFPRGLGSKFDAFAWAYRISSAVVPNSAVDITVDFVQTQSEQFRLLASVPAPEAVDRIIWRPDFSEIPSRSTVAYDSDDFGTFAGLAQLSMEERTRVLRRLEELLGFPHDRLQAAIRLFPLHHVRLTPQLYLPNAGSAIDERIVLCRARLIRRLGWPWHYQGASSWLAKYQNYEVPRLPEHEKLLLQCSQEVTEFLKSVEERFPVVLSKAFDDSMPRPNVP